jgi:hypothetical protein
MWEDVKGYEGRYQVSDSGLVRSLNYRGVKGVIKELVLTNDKKGYMNVPLTIGHNGTTQFKVHRLVAQAFLPNPDKLPQVNHKNGIKADNRVENLEWISNLENMRHSWASGLHKPKFGQENSNAKLSDKQVQEIQSKYTYGVIRQVDLAKEYGVHQTHIGRLIRKKG